MARATTITASLAMLLAVAGGGCASDPDDDIVGPYTGARTRYVVDRIVLPTTGPDTVALAGDLDGDEHPDNQLGSVIRTLLAQESGDPHWDHRIASGEIAMSLEIQADDLRDDDRAGVWLYGFDGAEAVPVGGYFINGNFIPNYLAHTQPAHVGRGRLVLPVMRDADSSHVELVAMELALVPDGTGGFDAQVHGLVDDGMALARTAIGQQLAQQPELHRWIWKILDTNHDGVVSEAEYANNSLLQSLLAPDITYDGRELLSIGVGLHLVPCEQGRCTTGQPVASCFDRVRDGDETDVDCGGACGRCGSELACGDGDDCQSGTCTAGRCTAPTCFDGIKNGYEASADCGGACALKCGLGQVCGFQDDCASNRCSVDPFGEGTGVCVEPET